ncbi:MAG: hypothetical protein QXG46_05480, partial [Ignisphaera sp.]
KGDNNVYVDSHILSGVAYMTSRECRVDDLRILKGYEAYVKSVMQGDVIRGIPMDRVVGKALSISNMIVKITGLTPLRY